MSSRCGCRFSSPADTILGSHRDPITSEKCWLDFAVRELSRVAAGKARGQEAVWRVQCKPTWWDSECPNLTWKNPTANPKDSKDTLKTKFECLVQHLRQENQIPGELEEEITLWEAGKISEVFLMTTFSSALGQVSNLHALLDDAFQKMANTGIGIHGSIPINIKNCLAACQRKIDAINNLASQNGNKPQASHHMTLKRGREDQDSGDLTPPAKQPRVSSPTISSSSSSPNPAAQSSGSFSNSDTSINTDYVPSGDSLSISDSETQKLLMKLQQKILLKKAEVAAAQQTPQVSARPRPKAFHLKASKRAELVQCSQPAVAVDSAAASVLISPLGPDSVTVTDPTHIPDLLEMDFLEETTITDYEFLDKLLAENSLIDDQFSLFTNPSTSTPAPEVETKDPEAKLEVEIKPTTLISPLTSGSASQAAENSTVDPNPILPVTVAGRSLSLEDDDVSFENIGADACSGAGDQTPDRYFSDAGYSSESSPPHRTSTDLVDENIEVNSPDFDDLLDSFNL